MRIIIVGAAGQDGQLLTQNLLERGDTVLAAGRTGTQLLKARGTQNYPYHVDILNTQAVDRTISEFEPDVVYYLAAYHHSSEDAIPAGVEVHKKSMEVHFLGLLNFLEAIRHLRPATKLFYASSSLIYGPNPSVTIATEETPWQPRCAYAISKAAGMNLCALYREQYGLFASCGILFNHESALRSQRFLSKKITSGLVAIMQGRQNFIEIADLDAGADFGYAPDFIEAMQMIMAHNKPDDFIIATGKLHFVRDWLDVAFKQVGQAGQTGQAGLDWTKHIVKKDAKLTRQRKPLAGCFDKLHEAVGWKPRHNFDDMVAELLENI